MMAEDLDQPLDIDHCERCLKHWTECRCQPTLAQLEAARRARLSRRELEAEQGGSCA